MHKGKNLIGERLQTYLSHVPNKFPATDILPVLKTN